MIANCFYTFSGFKLTVSDGKSREGQLAIVAGASYINYKVQYSWLKYQ
jgi:hypothetical protein